MQGDIILVGLRDYQDEKADVILKCDSLPLAWLNAPLHQQMQHIASPWLPAQKRLLIQCLSCRYMADEARSLKAYGELPDSSKSLHSFHNGCKAVCERLQGKVSLGVLFTDILVSWLQFVSTRQIPSLTRTEPMMSTLTLRTSQVRKLALNKSRGIMSRLLKDAEMLEDLEKGAPVCQMLWTAFESADPKECALKLMLSAVQRSSWSRAALQRMHHLRMAFCIMWQARREFC